MKFIYPDSYDCITIGRQTDNISTIVRFNINAAKWREEYGPGSFSLKVQRPGDAAPYLAVIDEVDNDLEWIVSASDTEKLGTGECQLVYTESDGLVKNSLIYTISILRSLGEGTTPPEPYEAWVNRVIAAADKVEEAVNHFPYIDETTGNWFAWSIINEDWYDTGVHAEGRDGYTPQRGIDYWTEEDKDEIVEDTTDEVKPLINAETQAREQAVNTLQGNINTIGRKIPEQASETNQLADKQFVNSSIATNTADFKGTYYLVDDLHLPLTATIAEIEQALSLVITSADKNDYAYVVVPDALQPDQILAYARFKYSESYHMFKYEYALNNSSFTAAQWAAINSGITRGDVALIATALQPDALLDYFTKQEVNNGFVHSENVRHETWTFTLEDNTVVTKEVMVWTSQE